MTFGVEPQRTHRENLTTETNMKQKPSVTLPALVKALGTHAIVEALGCDRSLPNKWARGGRPGWKYIDQLVPLADQNGLSLNLNFLHGAK